VENASSFQRTGCRQDEPKQGQLIRQALPCVDRRKALGSQLPRRRRELTPWTARQPRRTPRRLEKPIPGDIPLAPEFEFPDPLPGIGCSLGELKVLLTKIFQLNLPCLHPLAVFLPRPRTGRMLLLSWIKKLRSSQTFASTCWPASVAFQVVLILLGGC
jgi:hypothetical protein